MKKKKTLPLDQVLKALGDPVRLSAIRQLLDEGEKACGTFDHGVTKATFSHHINILVEAGIVKRREEGTRKFLSINADIEKDFPGLIKFISSH